MELLHHKVTRVIVIAHLLTSKLARKRKSVFRTLLRTFTVDTKQLFLETRGYRESLVYIGSEIHLMYN
jgi:hypothetical protein